MVTTHFVNDLPIPCEILIPMKLVTLNAGSRKIIIRSHSQDLPQPIAIWLTTHHHYRDKVAHMNESTES